MEPPLKHVVDDLLTITPANGSVQTITLVKGTINPNYITNNTDVRKGSLVRSINLLIDFGINNPFDANGTIIYDWYIGFNIANAQTLPNPNSVGGSDLAPQVFHQDHGLFPLTTINTSTGVVQPPHLIRLNLKIPKSWQRINVDDQIQLVIQKSVAVGTALLAKVKVIYYEVYP